jgi:hypothetical protein
MKSGTQRRDRSSNTAYKKTPATVPGFLRHQKEIINTLYKRNFHTPWRFLSDGSRSVRKL